MYGRHFIIAFCSEYSGEGKTTLSDMLLTYLKTQGVPAFKLNFSTVISKMVKNVYDMDLEKMKRDNGLKTSDGLNYEDTLKYLKKEYFSDKIILDYMKNEIENTYGILILDDLKTQFEYELLKEYKLYLILIKSNIGKKKENTIFREIITPPIFIPYDLYYNTEIIYLNMENALNNRDEIIKKNFLNFIKEESSLSLTGTKETKEVFLGTIKTLLGELN